MEGDPYFREPGHWLGIIVALIWVQSLIINYVSARIDENVPADSYYLVLRIASVGAIILGLLFIGGFLGLGKIADTWPWRAAMLFLGMEWLSRGLIGVFDFYVVSWRLDLMDRLAAAAMVVALVNEYRDGVQQHWTHRLAVYCWLCRFAVAQYWQFSPTIHAWLDG